MLCHERLKTFTTARFASRGVLGGSFQNLVHPISHIDRVTNLPFPMRVVVGLAITGARVLWEDS
jgi:hypothetical protein